VKKKLYGTGTRAINWSCRSLLLGKFSSLCDGRAATGLSVQLWCSRFSFNTSLCTSTR